ncbi:MAG: DUF4412 domain-containing protein [Deltaproteobacteria bacterium]|nr:DUF4412 domain-containing protein [Deltaproteobacteria bacterium]
MFAKRIVMGIAFMSLLAWSSPASAGWVIDQVVKGAKEGGKQQVVLQSNRMKTLMFGEDGKPATAFIMDLNAEAITQVNYEDRSYVTATVQEYVQTMTSAMSGAMKQMQEAMKNVPAEQRKMMEEMMRSQMGQMGQDCRDVRMELRKTGQQATVGGYPAIRYDVFVNGKPNSEIWIAKSITAWREMDAKKLGRFAAEMEKLAGCGPAKGQGMGADPSWKVVNEGYPVRTVDKTGSGATVEVVKAESRTIPAGEFQPPAGFARKTLREMTGQ